MAGRGAYRLRSSTRRSHVRYEHSFHSPYFILKSNKSADQQEADFLASEIALPLLQDNARRLKENMPRHCDIVLDFLDGGRGVLKFKEWSTSSVHINLEAGQRRIIITAANGDGHGEAINLLFFLHMSADGELSVRDASGRCRADLVT